MIEETGVVVEIDDNHAWVEAASSSSCSQCSANQGCGTASLQKWFKRKPNRLRVAKSQDVMPGERVVIGIPEQALVRGSFMIYMVPLLSLIAGALIGAQINDGLGWAYRDGMSILFSLSALVASIAWLKRYMLNKSKDSCYQPVILRRSH
jgi:sigma-E factor negative regulatory protein RseC